MAYSLNVSDTNETIEEEWLGKRKELGDVFDSMLLFLVSGRGKKQFGPFSQIKEIKILTSTFSVVIAPSSNMASKKTKKNRSNLIKNKKINE